ncbi:hypothetical protein [Pantoea sp. PNT02]|uniref:hypothetical protein n=1 Tax=Pantoea sp. PNT02 TaxID=2769261 RepID=UPI001CE214A2|nr:hypothetical protein [Pantoea sp. PNT02]
MPAGTIALTNGSNAVNGTGTSFTTELKQGDFVYVTVGSAPYTLVVSSVTSNTQLNLATAFDGPTTSGLAWNAVPASMQVAITQKILNDFAQVARGRILDFQNWQKIYSSDQSVTVIRPDRTTFTGPSWGYLATQIGNALNKSQNLNDLADKAAARLNLGVLPTSGGTMTGPISFDNVTARSATLANLGMAYISNDRISLFVDGNRQYLLINSTVVITTNASGDATVAYPTAFSSIPRPIAVSADWAAMNGNISTNNQTTTYFQVRCYKADGSIAANQAVRVDYIVFGRMS